MNQSPRHELTLSSALTTSLRACRSTNDGIAPPAAILWLDPKEHWRPLLPTLFGSIPELLVFGEYDTESRTGPAIWLRCMIDRALEAPELPPDAVPIVYLPGISRQLLRAGEDCADELKPLVELMYRGTLWLQQGGREWTVTAFVSSANGLGLDLSGDNATTEALLRALPEFAAEPVERYRGQRLEAVDFDQMLASDVVRDLLLWMDNPEVTRSRLGEGRWEAFRNQCKSQFGFDPNSDGETTAGEAFGIGEGPWKALWGRFEEAPASYPGVPGLLRRSKPTGLIFEKSRWPDENDRAENEVREKLDHIADLPHGDACAQIIALEAQHASRRSWIWNRLGHAPMAQALALLAEVAVHTKSVIGGKTPDDIAQGYIESGWKAERAAWQAIASAPVPDEDRLKKVVQSLLAPWADDCARAFQAAVEASPMPDYTSAELCSVPTDGCLLFADGLRYDLGEVLRERLEAHGCRVRLGYRWAALPTVTATAKPAVTPLAEKIRGDQLPQDFAPQMSATGQPANATALRSELESAGWQILSGSMADWPASTGARGWTEDGKVDTRGHQLQSDLPRILDKELDGLTNRILAVLDAGWISVRVVTDHGWVYLPRGLPKVELPTHLTASKWARCATVSGHSSVSVPTFPWHWNKTKHFATAPGVGSFLASTCYAHGGVSIQECLTPDLEITRASSGTDRAAIESVTWKKMRCFVVASEFTPGLKADLRLAASPDGVSLAASAKSLDEDGATTLLLEDDAHESSDLVVVMLRPDGTIIARHKTKVGIDS